MKRTFSLLLATLGAAVVALVPAGPASAHAGRHVVRLSVDMTIKDADWPDRDDYAYPSWTRDVAIDVATPSKTTRFEGCADEVRIVLDVTVSHNPSPFADGTVAVKAKTKLYEGESCGTTDLDASHSISFNRPEYTTVSKSWVVSSDGNSASVYMSVR